MFPRAIIVIYTMVIVTAFTPPEEIDEIVVKNCYTLEGLSGKAFKRVILMDTVDDLCLDTIYQALDYSGVAIIIGTNKFTINEITSYFMNLWDMFPFKHVNFLPNHYVQTVNNICKGTYKNRCGLTVYAKENFVNKRLYSLIKNGEYDKAVDLTDAHFESKSDHTGLNAICAVVNRLIEDTDSVIMNYAYKIIQAGAYSCFPKDIEDIFHSSFVITSTVQRRGSWALSHAQVYGEHWVGYECESSNKADAKFKFIPVWINESNTLFFQIENPYQKHKLKFKDVSGFVRLYTRSNQSARGQEYLWKLTPTRFGKPERIKFCIYNPYFENQVYAPYCSYSGIKVEGKYGSCVESMSWLLN